MTPGFDTKRLFLHRLMTAFDSPAFSNFSLYEWENDKDSGSALGVQRFTQSEALVVTFGTAVSGDLFVEYWVRPGPANTSQPTPEERARQATPVRIEFEQKFLQPAVNYVIEVVNSFYDSTFPKDKVVPIRRVH